VFLKFKSSKIIVPPVIQAVKMLDLCSEADFIVDLALHAPARRGSDQTHAVGLRLVPYTGNVRDGVTPLFLTWTEGGQHLKLAQSWVQGTGGRSAGFVLQLLGCCCLNTDKEHIHFLPFCYICGLVCLDIQEYITDQKRNLMHMTVPCFFVITIDACCLTQTETQICCRTKK
jgi:hypothetical protein